MLKKYFVITALATSLVASSVMNSSTAEENQYLPEYGTLAEHNEWAIKEIAVDKVAALDFTGAGVKVAVLDSGIAFSSPGINNKVIAYKDFLPSQQPLPDHGTQTAGIIASEYDAATGIRGVAPNASLIIARVCQMSSCDSIAIRRGLVWAVEQGAQVISMSFAGGGDPYMNAAITAAVNKGVVVVAAAGNSACQTNAAWGVNRYCKQGVISEQYSASFTIPGLISAGAIDQTRARASFSSWGPNLDLMAPGVNNVTYDPVGPTNGFGGTSASAPFIAGVAALTLGVNPRLTPQQVQAILQSTTKPALNIKPKVWDNCTKSEVTNTWACDNQVDNLFPQEYFTGAGIVNALAAVQLAQKLTAGQLLPSPSATPNGTQIKITWAGGPAALYSNNKLVAPNAASGFTLTGGYSQSYSFHIKRGAQVSEPTLLVLQTQITPSAPIVIERGARADEMWITTSDLSLELDQLLVWPEQIAAIFEFDNGKQIACSGYSRAPAGASDRPFYFSCPMINQVGPITGIFKLLNKYSHLSPGTAVEIPNVGPAIKMLDVRTTYTSSDSIHFDWDEVPGALSYNYRYQPNGEYVCQNESEFSLSGKSIQPSVFIVEAMENSDCTGQRVISSDIHPYVLLSPKPSKPTGVTVKNNDFTFVEFDVPNAKPEDQWRIYRSDGLMMRIYSGQRIAVGMQPNENVNGKTFSYRIMQVKNDTYGEVWSEPSDPIVVKIRDLAAPTEIGCQVKIIKSIISCSMRTNNIVESTFIEYLDFDGVVLASSRISNSNRLVQYNESEIASAAFVRMSSVTGKSNEWMRRGNSVTIRIASRTTKAAAATAH
jgi:subtilisin family serine protease